MPCEQIRRGQEWKEGRYCCNSSEPGWQLEFQVFHEDGESGLF